MHEAQRRDYSGKFSQTPVVRLVDNAAAALELNQPRKLCLQAAQRASKALLICLGMAADWSDCWETVSRHAPLIMALPECTRYAEGVPSYEVGVPPRLKGVDDEDD